VAQRQLAFYVSGHGFGHATRCVALIAALRTRAPGLRVHVRSQAPAWIFRERDARVECSAAPIDPGVIQPSGLDLDLPATLAAHQAFVADWESALEREARALDALAPALVVGDIPPLAFAAAARAGVPGAALANFSWDWIFETWAAADPRWGPIIDRYREAYAHAEVAYRLPFHGDFSAFRRVVDTPLLVNRSRRSRLECRSELGVSARDPRRLVLVSFGGFGSAAVRVDGAEDLSAYLFVGLGGPAPAGFPGQWIDVARPSPLPHEDLVHACDAIVGKAGYGTIAEALAHGRRFLFLPRADFPEVPVLEEALLRHGCARAMPRDDFASGRWRAHLDALFAQPEAPCELACNGADAIAEALLARIVRA
jgi:L-arabinokinase